MIIYTRSDIYYRYLEGFSEEYKMWISSLYTPLGWNYKEDWYIWQYLNRGVLEGYTGGEQYIDLNILNKEKDLDDLIIKLPYCNLSIHRSRKSRISPTRVFRCSFL